MRLEVTKGGPERLAQRAALWLADRVFAAVSERGVAHLAVSGGSSPLAMFSALAELAVPWEHLHVWQVDERVAPDGDPDRNAVGLQEHLLAKVPIPAEQVHLFDVTAPDLEAAATRYASELQRLNGGVLDIIHLGVGDDGHTASWPPGDPVVDITDRDVAVVGPFNGRVRMTLTVPAVNRGRRLVILVEGAAKAPVVKKLIEGDTSIPASHLRTTGTTILADEAAGDVV
jgi:6-phosphogluconolactonase